MAGIDEFMDWCSASGIAIRGIKPSVQNDGAVGVLATRNISAGEQVLSVPSKLVIVPIDVSSATARILGKGISGHGEIAARLVLDHERSTTDKPWKNLWPGKGSFASHPLNWADEVRKNLPWDADRLVKEQLVEFQRDWESVSPRLCNPTSSKNFELFKYYWLIVLTRCISLPFLKTLPSRDRLGLCPFVDFFNHTDTDSCGKAEVTENHLKGISIYANRAYTQGEELFLTYGRHSNDVLLTQYGFILSKNQHDSVRIDNVILRCRFSDEQGARLAEINYLEKFFLEPEGLSFTANVALGALVLDKDAWPRVMSDELDESEEQKVHIKALEVLGELKVDMKKKKRRLKLLTQESSKHEINAATIDLLEQRHKQIIKMIKSCTKSLHGDE